MFDLHRHDEYSTFDGFGKANELAKLAKELGHNALSTTNHGNTNGLILTYQACQAEGIKPILGVEGYFLPKVKEKTRGYHLILIAKDLKGYGNLNRIQYEGEKQKYYNPIWDFGLLEKYREGLICTSACVAGYLAQCIKSDKMQQAEKYLKKMKSIFKDDFYIEIQPYKISDVGLQEKVNIESIKLAKKLGIKCILTSDSHRGRKEDFPTYIKMHEVAKHDITHIEETYAERYMPSEKEIKARFYKMHKGDFGEKEAKALANEMIINLDEIYDKCESNYLDGLPLNLPKVETNKGMTSTQLVTQKVKEGLKERGKYTKEYIKRCKEELEVIEYHHFEDYFLIVADYVNWAKSQGIAVGPGRGSVCNSLVAYALKITEVDSLLFDLDFRRFLRKDKSKFPDIDLDFETSRRQEVIEYICEKYKGHAARICSYGLYKVDNLINDLAKVCGLEIGKEDEPSFKAQKKHIISDIKSLCNKYVDGLNLDSEGLLKSQEAMYYNKEYDDIILHFTKLFFKVRFIGTHAAGVAITGGELLDYTALRIDKSGNLFTNYDLMDLEAIKVIKFDILGLKTMESISNLRRATKEVVNYDEIVNDPKLLEAMKEGNCDGIFQFEKPTARKILESIECDCFNDVIAASAMNRPGPLSLHMPEQYAENKMNPEMAKSSVYYDYTKESYGTIIYQEQVQRICVNMAGMDWGEADKIMKFMKAGGNMTKKALEEYEKNKSVLRNKFADGVVKNTKIPREKAFEMFEDMICYTFNKGHATGYSIISMEEMYYKIYHPVEYWFSKLKFAKDDAEFNKFCAKAVFDNAVVFLPHVNYSKPKTSIRKVEGEKCIQQGLADTKGVGEKAALFICEERKKNGIFTSYDNFYDRCKSRVVTSRVIDILKEQGALEFKKKVYLNRVIKYNSAIFARANTL